MENMYEEVGKAIESLGYYAGYDVTADTSTGGVTFTCEPREDNMPYLDLTVDEDDSAIWVDVELGFPNLYSPHLDYNDSIEAILKNWSYYGRYITDIVDYTYYK